MLALGTLLSLLICWWEVRIDKYSFKEQWAPWKIWHTLTFPVAFYWVVGTLPMVVLQGKFWAVAFVAAGVTLFAVTAIDDAWLPGMSEIRQKFVRLCNSRGIR